MRRIVLLVTIAAVVLALAAPSASAVKGLVKAKYCGLVRIDPEISIAVDVPRFEPVCGKKIEDCEARLAEFRSDPLVTVVSECEKGLPDIPGPE